MVVRTTGGPGGGFPFTLEPVDGSGETRVFALEAPTAEERSLWLSAFSKANVNIGAEVAFVADTRICCNMWPQTPRLRALERS